jgi:GTPase
MNEAVFYIEQCYSVTGIGTIPVGKVTRGVLAIDMQASINGEVIVLKSIEKNHTQHETANVGESVGLSFKGNTKVLKNMKGQEIIFSSEGAVRNTVTTQSEKPKGFLSKFFGRN